MNSVLQCLGLSLCEGANDPLNRKFQYFNNSHNILALLNDSQIGNGFETKNTKYCIFHSFSLSMT